MLDKTKRILILVESPEKARTITKIFKDEGYNNVVVLATYGHFMVTKEGGGYCGTGINIEDFSVEFAFDKDEAHNGNKYRNTQKLKEQVKLADFIYICSDPDREGEAIAWECKEFLKIPKSKYKRATYQAIDKKSIFNAIDNPRDIDYNLVAASHCRLILDLAFGFRVSRIVKQVLNAKSAGRVQTPTLGLLVHREEEIQNFKPEKYIDLYLEFKKNNVDFKAKYRGTEKEEVKRLNTLEEVTKIYNDCSNNKFTIKNIEFKDRTENPKAPFSTSTFQQEAFNKLGLTAKQSGECAQQLFEAGKISYHRTDSEIFEEEFENKLKAYVKDNFDKKYVSGKVVKGKHNPDSQEGHEALHILDLELTPEKFAKECANELLVKVYRIIYNRTVATALKPAITAQTIYTINNGEHLFTLNSNELKFEGFKCVYAYKDDNDEQEDIVKETFEVGEELNDCSLNPISKETKPKSRYSEAAVLSEMENCGMGRPSTKAGIIETIKSSSRGYCVVENKLLKPTDLGINLVHYLEENFSDLVNVGYTRQMEESLDLIASGKLEDKVFLKNFIDKLEDTASKIAPAQKTCPMCGKPLKLRRGKYGAFWGCSGYPDCNYIEKKK